MASAIEQGIDTVAVATPDGSGRLIGKRVPAERYAQVVEAGLPMPDFHLITGIENVPLEGFEVTGVHTGFRNGLLRPDPGTLRQLPWATRTALVLCDAYDTEGGMVSVAPRSVLRRQLGRLEEAGVTARCASELEFYVFRGSYERARRLDYRRLVPSYHFHGDNDLLVAGRDEDLIGDIRRLMPLAGIPIEVSQGEGGPGQHELALEHAEPLEAADRHVVYKHGVKELAVLHGKAVTFMAKVHDEIAGSSGHLHLSLGQDGRCALGEPGHLSEFGSSFLAGVLAFTPELIVLHAPYANSYRRFVEGSWAPANLTWGYDNRTCLVRLVGSAESFRMEFRVPGADANPYHAIAGLIAAGLAGVERGLEPPPPVEGDAYCESARALPRDLTEAVAAFADSRIALETLGAEVRDHLLTHATRERDAVRRAVTDWDLHRGFERS
jgi:glutamine synthetase